MLRQFLLSGGKGDVLPKVATTMHGGGVIEEEEAPAMLLAAEGEETNG